MLDRDPKRRRLTSINAPFRSPLRRPPPDDQSTPYTASPSTPSVLPSSHPPRNSPLSQYTTPKRKLPLRTFRSPVLGRNADDDLTPEILSLIQQKRDLEKQIHLERKAVETAELALQYEKQVAPPNS
jgi:hypothetical protein